jgi:hypothetical protein
MTRPMDDRRMYEGQMCRGVRRYTQRGARADPVDGDAESVPTQGTSARAVMRPHRHIALVVLRPSHHRQRSSRQRVGRTGPTSRAEYKTGQTRQGGTRCHLMPGRQG